VDRLPIVAGVVAAAAAFGGVLAWGGDDDADGPARPVAAQADGRQVFARLGCGGCHTIAAAGTGGEVGPNLDDALATHDRRSLAAKIVDPYPSGPPGGMAIMPEDFGERMTDAELDALVTFLLEARGDGDDAR
jgi:cytochrome c oxidase subunit II